MTRARWAGLGVVAALALALAACGGGGGGSAGGEAGGCTGACPQQSLTVGDVQLVIRGAVAEATARGINNATIAVLDRMGNVLVVYQMPGADPTNPFLPAMTISSRRNTGQGLDGVTLTAIYGAISKAGTAAYLSSQGNAFTTRTASFIVQEHFPVQETLRPGGPLFGVQFSQLPCGDFVRRLDTIDGSFNAGPKRMPLGFSADPGGIPLYKGGVPVGGVGVEIDGMYSLDRRSDDKDTNLEERVAGAAANPFRAPAARRAERIRVDGRAFPFADDENFSGNALQPYDPAGEVDPTPALPDGPVIPADYLTGFWDGTLQAGVEFLTPDSGFVSSSIFIDGRNIPIERRVLPDGAGGIADTYPAELHPAPATCVGSDTACDSVTPAVGAGGLTQAEVDTILASALDVAFRARAQIRTPRGDRVRVNVHVVDLAGNIIGFARSQDAPIFGADVSLQKARTAAFFSNTNAAANLNGAAPFGVTLGVIEGLLGRPASALQGSDYVNRVQAFLGAAALTDGTAFSDRSGGNLSRPFFPDGDNQSGAHGPLSRAFNEWSPFGTGLQFDSMIDQLLGALVDPGDALTIRSCTPATLSTVRNGYQIFPGSVPIYRNGTLIGGLGASGDGVDQDDLASFLGLHEAGVRLGTGVGNAPAGIRADTLGIPGFDVMLRFVNCPPSAFLNENADRVCDGK